MGEEGECTQLTHSKTEECLAHQTYSPDEFLMILAWVSYFCYGKKKPYLKERFSCSLAVRNRTRLAAIYRRPQQFYISFTFKMEQTT